MFSKRFLWNPRNDVFAEEATKNYERQGAERCHRQSEDGSRPIETIPAILTPECGLVALEKLHYQLMTPMKSVVWKDDFSIFLLFGTFQPALSIPFGISWPPAFSMKFLKAPGPAGHGGLIPSPPEDGKRAKRCAKT